MIEIERAIEYYKENEFYMQKYNADLVTMKMNELALIALKEKLDREKNPLTCDGCAWERVLYEARCNDCIRARNYADNYEPKRTSENDILSEAVWNDFGIFKETTEPKGEPKT